MELPRAATNIMLKEYWDKNYDIIREISLIKNNFYDQAKIIRPYVDFFYLDVVSSGREVEAALEVTEKINLPVLVGLHVKKNGRLPSGESISEVVQKYKNNNWLGLVTACVSLEIINQGNPITKPSYGVLQVWVR